MKDGDSYVGPLVTVLETIILAAYGRKTDDGRFVKKINGCSLADEFESSQAYSELLLHLLSEAGMDEIEPLIIGIMPVGNVDTGAMAAKKAQMSAALNLK